MLPMVKFPTTYKFYKFQCINRVCKNKELSSSRANEWLMSNANEHFFFSYIMTSYNRLDNDMMMSALYSTNTDFYSATSLKQVDG
jgi:hypothetical protein